MILISKKERDTLLKQGCRQGKDIHNTHTRYPHYFLTESDKNMKMLEKIRTA